MEQQDGASCLRPGAGDRTSDRGASRASTTSQSAPSPSPFWCQPPPAGLSQLLFFFFFLIALRFWLRIILGSLENKDKSDLPCIPKGIGNWRDSLLFHFQTNLELKVLLVGFQSLFYGDAVMLRQPEKVTIPFFSALQASMFKSSFSLWPSTNWLCDVGSVASYVNRVRSE